MIVYKVQSVFLLYGRLYTKNAVISHQVCNNNIYIEILEKGRKNRNSHIEVCFLALWLTISGKQNHTKMRRYLSFHT